MSPAPMDLRSARRTFYLLTLTRWAPVGFVVGILVLLARERGLSVGQALLYTSAQGVMVLLLELPTSGFSDAFGRRPVLLVAAAVNVLTAVLYLTAYSLWQFVLAAACMGIYRALDSGPLEAWFVDTLHLDDPHASPDRDLARQGTILGVTIAATSLMSGGLVAWHPFRERSALELPALVFLVLSVVHLVATALLLQEPAHPDTGTATARAAASVRETPHVIASGLRLLRSSRVLRGVILVEIFWAAAMTVFEQLQSIRLAELLDSPARAGAWMGPVAAAGWAVFALAAHLSGLLMPRLGAARVALLSRVLNGLGAAVMGLVAGPAALVAAYLITYGLHGTAGPAHNTLMHREARAGNRATVLSLNSMVSFAAGSVAAVTLGALADATSTQTAMVTAGLFSVLGAACYLPALRAEPRRG